MLLLLLLLCVLLHVQCIYCCYCIMMMQYHTAAVWCGVLVMMMMVMVVVVVWRDACAASLHATKLPLIRRFSVLQKVCRHCTVPALSMASITDSHRKFFKGAEAVVKKKIQELKNRRRCLTCWHPKHLFCICKCRYPEFESPQI